MSNFDPDLFMQQTVDAPMETEYKNVPIGEYRAFIGDFDSKALVEFNFTYKKGDKAGQEGSMKKFTCPFVIDDGGQVAQSLGRDKALVDMQLIIDIDPTTGKLDTGVNKNVKLGQLRDAVGQNTPGQPWGFSMLRGQGPVMIKVVHTEFERADKTKGTRAEVERVSRIS